MLFLTNYPVYSLLVLLLTLVAGPVAADNALEIVVNHKTGATKLVPCLGEVTGGSSRGYRFCRINDYVTVTTTPSEKYPSPLAVKCKPAMITVHGNSGVRQCRPTGFKDPDDDQALCDMVNFSQDGELERCIRR